MSETSPNWLAAGQGDAPSLGWSFTADAPLAGLELARETGETLVADTSGGLYFLGLNRKLLGPPNYADLYAIDLDSAGTLKKVLTKLSRVDVQCDNGTGFRWGASALVVSRTKLRLFACEGKVQTNPKRIRLNIFHGENDPV